MVYLFPSECTGHVWAWTCAYGTPSPASGVVSTLLVFFRQGLEFFLERDLVRMAGQYSGSLPGKGTAT